MANLDIIIRTLGAGRAKSELDGLADTTRRAGFSVGGLNLTLADLAGGLFIAGQAFGVVKGAAEAAYAELQRGGELLKIAGQFETLTQKVGSTADAMLGKLKEATRGMVSDAELMASATQIISLGLAKTEEDTIRLATVVAGLGLDMQQVIMTFANDSKMRLDALGLSVEWVDQKVEELKAQGFEGDAFDQAVLLGLEERYGELGVSVDSVAGAMARLEAAAADARDAFSMAFAEGLAEELAGSADAIGSMSAAFAGMAASVGGIMSGGLGDALQVFVTMGVQIQALDSALEKGIITQAEYERQMARVVTGGTISSAMFRQMSERASLYRIDQKNLALQLEETAEAQDVLTRTVSGMPPVVAAAMAAGEAYAKSLQNQAYWMAQYRAQVDAIEGARMFSGSGARSAGAMDSSVAGYIARAERAYAPGDDDLARQFFGGYVSEAQRVMDANAQLNSSFLSLYDIIRRGGELPDPFTAMFESAARAGASIGTVLDLGEAIGRDRGQMEQAAKASFQQEFAGQLGQRIAQGMSIEDALREMEEFNQALEDGTATIDEMADPNNTVALDSMQAKLAHDRLSAVKEMMEKINNTRSTVYVDVVYSERGKPGGPLYDKAGQRGEGG